MNRKPSPAIRLIVGLGNPGAQYEDTRHNAGFWLVDRLAQQYAGQFKAESRFHGQTCRISVAGMECWLLKPTTYMNRSGQSVSSLARYFKMTADEILVAHDELDLPAGDVRLKQGGGHAGHNGLRDIMSALGGGDFWRARIGIGHPGERGQVVDYVLSRPSLADRDAIQAVIEAVAAVFPQIVAGEHQKAMNRLHGGR
jgi:PTH1 family peptidyl-tRNA hydrolase